MSVSLQNSNEEKQAKVVQGFPLVNKTCNVLQKENAVAFCFFVAPPKSPVLSQNGITFGTFLLFIFYINPQRQLVT